MIWWPDEAQLGGAIGLRGAEVVVGRRLRQKHAGPRSAANAGAGRGAAG